MSGTTMTATVGPTLGLVRWLLSEEVVASWYVDYRLGDFIGYQEGVLVLCSHIDASGRSAEFAAAAQTEGDVMTARWAAVTDPFLKSLEEPSIESCRYDAKLLPADGGQTVAAVRRLLLHGMGWCGVGNFVTRFIGQEAATEVLAREIDARGRFADFDAKAKLSRYRRSPALAALGLAMTRADLHPRAARRLTIGFLKQDGRHRLAESLCRIIDARGDFELFLNDCKRDLHDGIDDEVHARLEEREVMTTRDIERVSELLDAYPEVTDQEWWSDLADPAVEAPWVGCALGRAAEPGWGDPPDPADLVVPRDDDWSPPPPSIWIGCTTAFEALRTLVDAGLLSERAARGYAVRFVESDDPDGLPALLCEHFDAVGQTDDFAEYVRVVAPTLPAERW